jgi:hypothetical protein
MKLHVRRFLYLIGLYLKQAVKELSASRIRTPDPPFSVSPRLRGELPAESRFFFIVVEVCEEDKALVRADAGQPQRPGGHSTPRRLPLLHLLRNLSRVREGGDQYVTGRAREACYVPLR